MSKKIKVLATPSETQYRTFEIDLEDLGCTAEEWKLTPEPQKEFLIQKVLDNMPDQPYWAFDSIVK